MPFVINDDNSDAAATTNAHADDLESTAIEVARSDFTADNASQTSPYTSTTILSSPEP